VHCKFSSKQGPGGEPNINGKSLCPQEAYNLTEVIEGRPKIRQNKSELNRTFRNMLHPPEERTHLILTEPLQDGSKKKSMVHRKKVKEAEV
jgi:hypothetical protein